MIANKHWGFYETYKQTSHYLVKKLVILPYKKISLQAHNHRNEHWTIIKGNGIITIGNLKMNMI